MVMSLDLRPNGYDKTRGQAFYRDLMERVENLPGIESASLARVARLSLGGSRRSVTIEGYQARPGESLGTRLQQRRHKVFANDGYSYCARTRLYGAGQEGATFAVIINEAMARRYFPNQDAIGKRLTYFCASRLDGATDKS